MPITYDAACRAFHLRGPATSYIMQLATSGHLLHRHWGTAVGDTDVSALNLLGARVHGTVVTGHHPVGLDQDRQECPTGRGDFRLPAVQVRHSNGAVALDLRYVSHAIVAGKPQLPGLPATYVEDAAEADTLTIVLRDAASAVEVHLAYTQFRDHDAVARSTVVVNGGQTAIDVLACASAACDLDADNLDLITLDGAWCRDSIQHRTPLRPGLQAVGSRRGISTQNHSPFIAVPEHTATETTGLVRGVSLVYSGNHRMAVEVDGFAQARVVAGINPEGFTWHLAPGASFSSPEAVLVASTAGLGGMSRIYHRLYRTRLVQSAWRDRPRPVLINNWEGTYFDFNTEKLVDMARSAKDLGCDLFVLDDGWFGARTDDTKGLGDWIVNERVLPGGLARLAREISAVGMTFGLWIEPEMVNPNSDLYRAHPDWALHLPGHERWEWRNQLVLDLTRDEVRDHVMDAICAVLRSAPIGFVKWDMNRSLDALWSADLPAAQQGEVAHRYCLAVYAMHERLRREFPDLLLEGCASGGSRFDPGLLHYAPQIWTSDCSDAIERLDIQRGCSLVHPPSAISAHVTAAPNHQLHRSTPLSTRARVAGTAAFGLELDPRKMTPVERDEVRGLICEQRRLEVLFRTGDLYRLDHDQLISAWLQVSADRAQAVVTAVARAVHGNAIPRRIRLAGLDPAATYTVNGPTATGRWSGSTLMAIGLPIEPVSDWQSWRWELSVA